MTPKQKTPFTHSLRREGIKAENALWYVLKNRQLNGLKFRRQYPVGPYIADFMCLEEKLIIKIDGGQHNYNASDTIRDAWLRKEGYKVLRFWNTEVLENRDGILQKILEQVSSHSSLNTPHPSTFASLQRDDLSPKGRGIQGEFDV